MTTKPEIFTVGHSTHSIAYFLELLESAEIRVIADVRRFPGSRRNPQFGAAALERSLAESGIAYESFGEELGGRRRTPKKERIAAGSADARPDNSAWRNASFRAYADYMAEAPFATGLERLQSLAAERRTAVMCAEAHPSRCHRQLIADIMLTRGWSVCHLLADKRVAPHSLSPHAVAGEGELHYPGSPQLEL